MKELFDSLKDETSWLEQEFSRASKQGSGTPQEIADYRENAFNKLLANCFPYPFKITKGKIRDANSNVSASIDSIIVNPVHPHFVDGSGKFRLILADGVDAAIELKPDLSTISELERGLIQGVSVKKIRKNNSPILLKAKADPNYLEFTHHIPFLIYGLDCKSNIEDTLNDVKNYYSKNNVSIEEQADLIVIQKKGILFNCKYDCQFKWDRTVLSLKDYTGWYIEDWGENVLAGMLFHLNFLPSSTATIQKPILEEYVTKNLKLNHIYYKGK